MARLFGWRETEKEQRDELLSAYLDDQLNAEERAGLEAQLAIDSDLRAGLDALRHTVALVRDMPPVPVPRNFILPQTAATRPQPARPALLRRAWAAPFLTAATAVMGLLFAVVLAGDLLFSGVGRMGSAPMPEAMMLREAEMDQEAPAAGEAIVVTKIVELEVEVTRIVKVEAETVIETVVEEVEVVVEAEAEVAEKAVSTPTPAPPAAEAPLAAEVTITPEPEGLVAEADETEEAADVAAGGGGPEEEPTAPVPTSTPSPDATEETEDAMAISATETPMPGANGVAPEPVPPPGEAREGTPPVRPEPGAKGYGFTRIHLRRALEAVLGLIMLGLIGLTIWAWRVRRR